MVAILEKEADVKTLASELVKRINEDSRRIRTLEQRIDRVENSISSLEDDVLTQLTDLRVGLEKISDRILQISEKISATENEILRLNKDLAKTATKIDVKQLETFIDLVNPITSRFVTRDELERMLEERLAKKK